MLIFNVNSTKSCFSLYGYVFSGIITLLHNSIGWLLAIEQQRNGTAREWFSINSARNYMNYFYARVTGISADLIV